MNLKNLINPAPAIGALEISDLALRFLRLENGEVFKASVQLPPGVVNGGKISDRSKFVNALRYLHEQIQPFKKSIHVVVAIPASNIFMQSFVMPPVSQKNLKETAELNLQMISPIESGASYRSYEIIGENKQGQIEAIGAFTGSEAVDEFVSALKQANFRVVAVEFPALSLARLVKEYGAGLEPDNPYLVVNLTTDGPDLMVIKNGHIYFNYFNSWSAIQEESGGRKITAEEVKEFLARQIKQVINFFSSRSGVPIKDAIVVNNPVSQEIIGMIRQNFPLTVQLLTVGKYSQLSPGWYVVLGAALRGLIPRSEDRFMTLTAIGVEEEYYRELTLNFIKSWRNIIAVVFSFVFLVFLIADGFLLQVSNSVAQDLKSRSLVPLSEIQELQASVQKFNQGVDFSLKAQELSEPWSPLLEKVRLLAGQRVGIERLFIDPQLSALIIGKAVNDSAVIVFKNSMEKEPNFKDVVLPLSNIKVNPDGTVLFTLQFKIISL